MGRGGICLRRGVDDLTGGPGNLGQRRGERHGLSGDLGTTAVRAILARAADRHLHKHGGERSENDHQDDADNPQRIVAVAVATEQHAEIGQHGNRTGDGRGHGHHQRIAVAHMRQFMGHHPRDLVRGKQAQQAGGRGDGGVLRIAPRGKGIGLRIVHDVNLGHGQAGTLREVFDQLIEFRCCLPVHLAGAMHAQHHLVGVPVSEDIHARSHQEGNEHALLAAKQIAYRKKQAHQGRHQQTGAHGIHAANSSLPNDLADPHMMAMTMNHKTMSDRPLSPEARRALAEAEERRKAKPELKLPKEVNGRDGPEPTRFGDWEKKGITSDF